MNFGQALAALLNGRNVTCPELNRPGSFLGIQAPTGKITQAFIYLQLANGEAMPWTPDQPTILSTGWTQVNETAGQAEEVREHAGARS